MGVSKSRNVLGAPPVHFSNDSSSIELRIVDYQYPENSRDQYDADWLRVEGVITHPLGNWRFNDPCLLTWEALALATWLDSWGKSTDPEIGFIEPNLSFAKSDSPLGSLLRISFELESRPPWAKKRFVGPSDIWIEFPPNESGAKSTAETLRDQLRRFPIRVGA